MFHKKSTKLAGLYLAIMMLISLFFSVSVYQLSTQEFDRGLRRPGPAIQRLPAGNFPIIRDELIREREQQYREAKSRVLNRLILTNLLILLGGGFLSYYLALRTLKPIEEAQEAQNRFTADASHELRTPITAMRSENEVALMNPKLTLAAAKQQLASNIEELEKLTRLSEGLLRLAQFDNNHLKKETIRIRELVELAISRVMPRAEKKKILITTAGDTEMEVLGDEAGLVEALVIILDNAVKYSPSNKEIIVACSRSQKEAVLQVKDQGFGIKASELPHIFDRFYRADSSRSKNKIEGYGLGLAIAKNIIDTHDGSIMASSIPGKGTTFTLRIPLKT